MPGVLFFPIEITKNKLSPRSIPIKRISTAIKRLERLLRINWRKYWS